MYSNMQMLLLLSSEALYNDVQVLLLLSPLNPELLLKVELYPDLWLLYN